MRDEAKLFDRVVPEPDEAVSAVVDYVQRRRAALRGQVILGMGIATPGFTDPATGDIISNSAVCPRGRTSPSVAACSRCWACLPTSPTTSTAWRSPSSGTPSESLEQNLAYVGYDEAVKTSLFLGGTLYKGSLGNAGLVEAVCSRVGDGYDASVVAALLTVNGVNQCSKRRWRRWKQPSGSACTRPCWRSRIRLLERFRCLLMCDDPKATVSRDLAADLCLALAAAVANVILIVQPDVVVLGGLLSALREAQFAELAASIRSHLPALIGNNTLIRRARHAGHDIAAIGADHHFLQI